MCHPAPEMLSALNWSLLWKRPDAASFLQLNWTEPIYSHIGWLSALPSAMDPSLMTWPPPSTSTSSSSLDTVTIGDSSTAARSPSDLNAWRKPYVPWGRSSPDWTSLIPDWMEHATSSDLEPFFEPGTMKTQPLHESGPLISPSPSLCQTYIGRLHSPNTVTPPLMTITAMTHRLFLRVSLKPGP